MRSGTKHLRIASAIQIIVGIMGLILTYFLIGAGDITVTGIEPNKALGILVLTYAGYIFQIFAGIVGLILANKKSIFTIILGVLLFVPCLVFFLHLDGSMGMIIMNIITLAIPYYYLHNAYKNYKA